jgi:hypothetical protein
MALALLLLTRRGPAPCSSPPGFGRRPSYFHLLAQMKETKAKCLNTIWLVDVAANWRGCWATEEIGSLPLGPFAAARLHRPCWGAERGAGLAIKNKEFECSVEARLERSVKTKILEYSANPNRGVQVNRSARWNARQQRPVKPPGGERPREETEQSSRWSNYRASFEPRQRAKSYLALCFGYFHLCQQMKVTRPPAETRRAAASCKPSTAPARSNEPAGRRPPASQTRYLRLNGACPRQ